MNKPEAIIITSDWPGETGGGRIGIRSELEACRTFFSGVRLLVFSDRKTGDRSCQEYPGLDQCHVPCPRKPLWIRFLRSLPRRDPSVTIRYRDVWRPARKILELFRRQTGQTTPPVVILNTTPVGILIPLVREVFPESPVVLHSDDFVSRALAGFARQGKPFSRAAWSYELARLRRFEKRVAGQADHFWCISENDRDEYHRMLGVRADGILGIYLDIDRFQGIPPGNPKTLVHIGRLDLRKSRGMDRFIRDVWPAVRRVQPDARLVLGGAGTEKYDRPGAGIQGIGFVDDECDVLRQGMIFINPQVNAAGIQLKCLVAMLSGRLLISTAAGARGIAGNHPTHFLAADNPEAMARMILDAVNDPRKSREIAIRGQEIARETYSREKFLRDAHVLLGTIHREADNGKNSFRRRG